MIARIDSILLSSHIVRSIVDTHDLMEIHAVPMDSDRAKVVAGGYLAACTMSL